MSTSIRHPATLAAPTVERGRQSAFVLLTMLAAGALVFAATAGVTAAIPSMARGLRASQSDVQLIADGYPVVLGALVLAAGGLLDRHGRRRGMLIGLALFSLCQLWSAVAGSPVELIASRCLAGAGAALVLPGTLATLSTVMPPEQRGRAVSYWAGGVMVGGALGVLVTGAAIAVGSWRTSFALMAALGLVALLGTARCVPETFDPEHATIDPPGAALACVAIGGLVFAIIELPARSIGDPLVLAALLAGASALAAFVWWELRTPRPLLDLRLFAKRSFAIGTVSLTLVFGAAFGWFFLSFLYFSIVLGYSPLLSGVCLMPMAVSVIPIALASPRLAARFGRGRVIAVGLLVMAAGDVAMVAVSSTASIAPMAAGFCLFGLGIGLGSTPPTEAIIEALPPAQQGVASAVNDAARELGAAVGVAVLGSLFNAGYRSRVGHLLAGLPHGILSATRSSPGAIDLRALTPVQQAHVAHAVRAGVISGWQVAFVGAAVALVLGALLIHLWSSRSLAAPAADDQRWEHLHAALALARERSGTLALVRFAEGPDRWTVFVGGEPLAAFPPVDGDLAQAASARERSPLLSAPQLEAALGVPA